MCSLTPDTLFMVWQYYETEWTLWSRFDIEGKKDGGEMTLGEFMDLFKVQHPLVNHSCTFSIGRIAHFLYDGLPCMDYKGFSVSLSVCLSLSLASFL